MIWGIFWILPNAFVGHAALTQLWNMLIKTQIVINKNTQQFHMGHRFDQINTNIKIKDLFIFMTLE